jgi:stress-induced morphogen
LDSCKVDEVLKVEERSLVGNFVVEVVVELFEGSSELMRLKLVVKAFGHESRSW